MKNRIVELFESGKKFKVKWTKIKKRGSSVEIKQCQGTVVNIKGNLAMVKENNATSIVRLADLRLENEKGQLTEFFENLAKAE